MLVTAIKNGRRVMHRELHRLREVEKEHDGTVRVRAAGEVGTVFMTISKLELERLLEVQPGQTWMDI